MAIKLPDPGNGIAEDKTGYNEWENMKIVRENFADPSHAASRLVGTSNGQVPLAEQVTSLLGTAATKDVGTKAGNVLGVGNAFGLGGGTGFTVGSSNIQTAFTGFGTLLQEVGLPYSGYSYPALNIRGGAGGTMLTMPYSHSSVVNLMGYHFVNYDYLGNVLQVAKIYTDKNTTIVNGSLKPSSPVVKIHTDSLELNDDAKRMGVTLNKRGVGDYLLQNTTGLRNDGGWRIELPQDVNGNPYFAVEYNELENNNIEVKTYKRIFDMSTFMFVPDFDSPVDIKEGTSIAIRFNDLPLDDLYDTQMEV